MKTINMKGLGALGVRTDKTEIVVAGAFTREGAPVNCRTFAVSEGPALGAAENDADGWHLRAVGEYFQLIGPGEET